MEITEVRVKLVGGESDRVRAFCSVTLGGDFVIRDLKVIDGTSGLFVAMPSRKLADHCPKCSGKNHMRARFCNNCGAKLNENRAGRDIKGRKKLHADVAHPINAECREQLQSAVIEAYSVEFERSTKPGYVPQRMDEDDFEGSEYEDLVSDLQQSMGARRKTATPRSDANRHSYSGALPTDGDEDDGPVEANILDHDLNDEDAESIIDFDAELEPTEEPSPAMTDRRPRPSDEREADHRRSGGRSDEPAFGGASRPARRDERPRDRRHERRRDSDRPREDRERPRRDQPEETRSAPPVMRLPPPPPATPASAKPSPPQEPEEDDFGEGIV